MSLDDSSRRARSRPADTFQALVVRAKLGAWAGGMLLMLSIPDASGLQGQISPGPLARAHRELEGATNCAQCHGRNREPMTTRCLACHKDIAALMQENRGYHGREVKAGTRTCAQCHPDHAGTTFRMIEWPDGGPSGFDHRKAGYALEGAHAKAKCESCHATRLRTAPVAALSARKGSAGWIGLGTTCASCHREDDVHKGDVKERCESCHDAKEWTKATKFDHEKTDYPLTGEHQDVACAKCHETPRLPVRLNADGKRVGTFKPVPFRECSSCHQDPHKSALGPKCSDCHVTRGFGVIDKAGFSHQVTKYPLRGKHLGVSCEACHGQGLADRTPTFGTCAACHRDVHRGEATLEGKAADCAACHVVSGFVPSTFTVAQHQKARYALEGKHLTVKCSACHTPTSPARGGTAPVARSRTTADSRTTNLRPAATTCASCHQDAHDGDLVARGDRGACEACHTTSGFAPSTYGVAAHAALRVTLEGRHGLVLCKACHGASRPGLPPLAAPSSRKAKVTIGIREVECASCHVDPHGGRYASNGALPQNTGCAACHNAVAWRPATTTNALHAGFSFRLDGAHRAVPCVACHDDFRTRQAPATLLLAARGIASLSFTATRTTSCVTCHETPHGSQFAHRADKGGCEGCHSAESFVPAIFDHEKDATFSLRGAHAKVPCSACHKPTSETEPVTYRPLSGKCESCHAAVPKGGRTR